MYIVPIYDKGETLIERICKRNKDIKNIIDSNVCSENIELIFDNYNINKIKNIIENELFLEYTDMGDVAKLHKAIQSKKVGIDEFTEEFKDSYEFGFVGVLNALDI